LPDEAQVYNNLKLFFLSTAKGYWLVGAWGSGSVLLFTFSLLDGGGAALAKEVGAIGVWLVKTAASGRSTDEDSSTEDWLVETATLDS
jgi:hypothetical protein